MGAVQPAVHVVLPQNAAPDSPATVSAAESAFAAIVQQLLVGISDSVSPSCRKGLQKVEVAPDEDSPADVVPTLVTAAVLATTDCAAVNPANAPMVATQQSSSGTATSLATIEPVASAAGTQSANLLEMKKTLAEPNALSAVAATGKDALVPNAEARSAEIADGAAGSGDKSLNADALPQCNVQPDAVAPETASVADLLRNAVAKMAMSNSLDPDGPANPARPTTDAPASVPGIPGNVSDTRTISAAVTNPQVNTRGPSSNAVLRATISADPAVPAITEGRDEEPALAAKTDSGKSKAAAKLDINGRSPAEPGSSRDHQASDTGVTLDAPAPNSVPINGSEQPRASLAPLLDPLTASRPEPPAASVSNARSSSQEAAATLNFAASDLVPSHPFPSTVHVARIVEGLGQSEMLIGLRTHALGNIEVRTTIHDAHVGVIFGSDRSDLRTLLSGDLPTLEARFRQHDLRLDTVQFLNSSTMSDSGFSSSPHSQDRSWRPQSPANLIAPDSEPIDDLRPEAAIGVAMQGGLNVHA